MKIYGDDVSTLFKTYTQEPDLIYGYNDVLVGDRSITRKFTFSSSGNISKTIVIQPKLFLHISNTVWSSFTGMLKEYFLPWRWKVAYLDQENGTPPQRILVCTRVHDGKLSDRLKKVIGHSMFAINLINANYYDEIFGQEYLRTPRQGQPEQTFTHPLGKSFGLQIGYNHPNHLCHIYRIRGIFSLLKYHFLKNFSQEWEEVAMQIGQISENVLIKRNDRMLISTTGLIR